MRVSEYVKCDLLCSLGIFKLGAVNITETVNGGVNWSASLIDHIIDPLSVTEGLDLTIRIRTLSDEYISPPLICEAPTKNTNLSGKFGALSGIDKTTWLMSRDDLSFDTFINQTSRYIIDQCAGTVSVSVFGVESFPMSEEDVKNSKILDVLTRLLEISAQNYRIRRDGAILCFPVTYLGPVNESLRYTDFNETISHAARVDSIKIEKTSRIAGGEEICFRFDSQGFKTVQLPSPLYRATPIDRSSYGYISLVTTFNGDLNGPVTGLFPLRDDVIVTPGPIDYSLPSTHASLVVMPPLTLIGNTLIDAKVCFVGNPADPNIPNNPIPIQPAFRRKIGSGTRPSARIWTDTIHPNPQWLQDHSLGYMIEANKGYHTIAGDGPLNLTVDLVQAFTSPGHSTGKIMTFTHSVNSKSNTATTSVSGYVPYPTVQPPVTTF